MSNILSQEEEENVHGFTGDMKDFLREGDFESAIVLIDNLKKYILDIKRRSKNDKRQKKNITRCS